MKIDLLRTVLNEAELHIVRDNLTCKNKNPVSKYFETARSKTKCNIFRRKCCMGKKYKQLNLEERTMIQTQLSMGFKPGRIARELGRSASTLSRELKRNDWVRPVFRRGPGRPLLAGGYRAEVAHCCAHASSVKPRVERRLQPGGAL